MPVVPDYTDCCNNCLCSIPRSWAGGPDLRAMSKPFYCNHPSHGPDNARKVRGDKAFGSNRPEWCPLDKGEQVLIQLRPPGVPLLND